MQVRPAQITELLRRWTSGDSQALEELTPIVYNELQRLAHYHLQHERGGQTLQTTALVHEVYLRLCDGERPQWESRAHLFAVAARIMRHILVDHARRRGADKRGAGAVRTVFQEALSVPVQEDLDLVELNIALDKLAAVDARKCQVVEMRFFAGMHAREIAAVLGATEATVRRDWIIAKSWLYRYLEGNANARAAV